MADSPVHHDYAGNVRPEAVAPAPPGLTIGNGRYVVRRLLGEGSRKRVYLAHDSWLDREVAIAVLRVPTADATARTRLREEAQAAAGLGDHPHIVPVYDVGEDDGGAYIVGQALAGGSLEDLLAASAGRPLPNERALRIARDVCAALVHAHARGVIHRDVKPANVWLTGEGRAKLGDFGLATTLDRARLEDTTTVRGTIAYMAPEQALGDPPDARSDLYALGAMLYEMVSGRLPFVGDDPVTVIHQHLHASPVPPSVHNPDVTPRLEGLVLGLLVKKAGDRPASAAVVAEALEAVLAAPADDRLPAKMPNPLNRLAGAIFVGREREMSVLRGAVEGALLGGGRLVLVHGDPGTGKTRTAEELATYASLRGAEVIWGRCYEAAGAPAFWPWRQILRAVLGAREPAASREVLDPGVADIAELTPELIPDPPRAPALASEQDRFRLFDSVTTCLKRAARERALVLVLDDLHGADASSLVLLQFLAHELRETRMVVLATYRDSALVADHPLLQLLAEAAREPRTERIALGGLSERETGRFIELSAGLEPPQALVGAVYRETDGNPFFVTEVVRLLIADGGLERSDGRVPIPPTVRAAVERRLAQLSAATHDVLALGAVIGRDFGLDVLERMTPFGVTNVLDAMEAAVAARLLVGTGTRSYRFTHALVRETLYDALGATSRRRLHQQVGRALEMLNDSSPDPPLAELAHHFSEAGPDELERAVRFGHRAADRAMEVLAYEEAVRLYTLALETLARATPHDDRHEADLLLLLGEARRKAGDVAGAEALYHRSAAVARRIGATDVIVRAAIAVGEGGVHRPEVPDPEGIALLEEALAALKGERTARRAQVLASLGVALFGTDYARARAVSEEALIVARSADAATLAFTLRQAHFILWGPDLAVTERLAIARELGRLGREVHDAEVEAEGTYWAGFDLLELGDTAPARREFETFTTAARRLRRPMYGWWATYAEIVLGLLEGRYSETERLTEGVAKAAEQAHGAGLPMLAASMLQLRLMQGRFDEAEAIAKRNAAFHPLSQAWPCGLAYLDGEWGRVAEARERFQRLAANGFADLRRDINGIGVMCLLASVCSTLDDAGRAARLYELLAPHAARNVIPVVPVASLGVASRYLGLLAATMGRWDDAAGHFEDALARNTRMGARPWVAFTQYDFAAMLLRRGAVGDRARAGALLDAALPTARALGMVALAARIERMSRTLGGPRARGRAEEKVRPVSTPPPQSAADGGRYRVLKTTEELRRAEILAHRPGPTRRDAFADILGTSRCMEEVFALMEAAAECEIAVVIEGETGTGKELVARAIHRASARSQRPFLPVNCAAVPETLLESELFGHRRGAFTGAARDHPGLFQAADGGTVFLDEIGDMPLAMQAKLLRVLQDGEVLRVGDTRPRRVDVRFIAATHRDLARQVAEGGFREDLYYRLTGFPIRLPPLRERGEDLPALAEHFIPAAAARHRRPVAQLAPEARELLVAYDWPGNVRELENELARAVVLAAGRTIGPEQLSPKLRGRPAVAPAASDRRSLRKARAGFEAGYIAETLRENGGSVTKAARALGMSRAMLHKKIRDYDLR